MGQLSDFNQPGPTESAITRASGYGMDLDSDAGELIHNAADTLRVAAEAVMDCLHQYDDLDEQDREFAAMELPSLLSKVREAAKVFSA